MAKFKQYKLPDGTVLLCKDEIAGKTLNLTSDKILQLLDEAGTVRSQVQLPAQKVTILDSGMSYRFAGLHVALTPDALTALRPTFTEKILYLIDEETGRLIKSIAQVDAAQTYVTGMQYHSYAAASIASGACLKTMGGPQYNGTGYSGATISYPSVPAEVSGGYFLKGIINTGNYGDDLNLDFPNATDSSEAYVSNGLASSASLANGSDYDASYWIQIPSLFRVLDKEETQFIYNIEDYYIPWAPQFTRFKFYIGGLGSHIVTGVGVSKWNDSTKSWASMTAVGFTQDPDTEQVSLSVSAGDNDFNKVTRELIKLTVTTSEGTCSILLSPATQLYT